MKKYLERQQHKTSEGEFIYELETQYELCPKIRESILETAKRCLVRDNVLKEGEIEVSVIAIEERSGKLMEKMSKVRVRLTIDKGKEDIEIQKEFGRIALRQVRIQRITEEAIEQGGVLSQEDIAKYIGCDVRTIKRYVREIRKRGIGILTRGVLHCIGRGQTHKSRIIGLYLDGQTFSDIRLKTHHSVGAIKRYLQSFINVLMSREHGIKPLREISLVTGISEYLVKQYVELIEQSMRDKQRLSKLESLAAQWKRAGTRVKKSLILDEFGRKAVHMTGGAI